MLNFILNLIYYDYIFVLPSTPQRTCTCGVVVFFFKEKNDKIMYLSRWKNCGFQLAQFVKSFFFFLFFFLKKIVKSLIAE